MQPLQIIFLILASLTIMAALLMVSARKVMHAALWLVATLLGVAGIFATLESGFFAAVQIVVYIGAIAMLVIFAVMLTRQSQDGEEKTMTASWLLAALLSLVVLAGMLVMVIFLPQAMTEARAGGAEDIAAIGKALVDPQGFLIPFETASILLMAALIGAVFIAGEHKDGAKS